MNMKTQTGWGRDYMAPMMEFYQFVPESGIMVTSTLGNTESYSTEELKDLWM